MFPWIVAPLALILSLTSAAPAQNSQVVIDGQLTEGFWEKLAPGKFAPVEAGVPADQGGEVRSAIAGRYLYLSARLPEPSGRLTARSIGRNPIWEGGGEAREVTSLHQYTYGTPEGEDYVRFLIRVSTENDWMLQVGPLGAYSVKWHWTGEREWYTSPPEKCDRFLVSANVGAKEWSVEIAIPLDQLGSPRPGEIRLIAERNRAQRPTTPQEQWRWPIQEGSAEIAVLPGGLNFTDPLFKPPALGNREPVMEVGHRKDLPPLDSEWTDPAWRDVAVWALHRNEAAARTPLFPTEVKLMHNGGTLAVLARCIEPDLAIDRAKEGDDSVDEDDSFQVYLATTGASFVQYAIDPRSHILDAVGHSGNPRLSQPDVSWNSPVQGRAWREQGGWVARMDLPLDAIAEVMGEVHTPRDWTILLLRSRPGRNGEPRETSEMPVTQSVTPFCPARYRHLRLVDKDPTGLAGAPIKERSGDLAFFPTRVLTSEERKDMNLAEMVEHNIRSRVLKILAEEKGDWDQVNTLSDWERFRARRIKALEASVGVFPPQGPLQTRVTSEFRGEGYRRQNLVYQSRPGLWVTANLYLPAEAHGPMPGVVIVHSHHAPKSQFELQDMGIIWARGGCAVLVMDQIGYGERIETYPWDREAHNSSHIIGMQLQLAGENLMAWTVWDILRGVDLLLERHDVNEKQVILMGAVAGGGDPAAVAAALDSRIAAIVPFNFGEAEPEESRFEPQKNQWPLEFADPGWGDMASTGALRGAIVDQFFPWTICASVAPRRFIYSFELGWNVEDLPAWARYRKVFGLYNALDHLANAHGFGPFPGPGECWNIGPAQRRSLYPTLERWFGIPLPFSETENSVSDNLARGSVGARGPVSELAVLNPEIASELHLRTVHELIYEEGEHEVDAARAELEKLPISQRRQWLDTRWASKLGDIEPNDHPEAKVRWRKEIPGAEVEGITLTVEQGISVPLLLLRPRTPNGSRTPVVVAISEGGKDLFVAERSLEVEGILKGGMAVCFPDLRGTGETAPDPKLDPDGDEIREHLSASELMLDNTLLGKRLKDLRTVLAYLEARPDIDSHRLGLWGDSLSPANPSHLLLDEQVEWQIGPEIEQQAEPLGGLLAILGAFYDDRVRTVALRGGLGSYLSLLEDNFTYVPADVIVPGALESGDIADLAAALSPRPVRLEGLIDGQDRLIPQHSLEVQLRPVYQAYRTAQPSALSVGSGEASSNFALWFISNL